MVINDRLRLRITLKLCDLTDERVVLEYRRYENSTLTPTDKKF